MIIAFVMALLVGCTGPVIVADSDLVVAHRKLAVVIGQSNARGAGLVVEIADQGLADPYPAVRYVSTIGNDANPPMTLSYPVDALGPRLDRAGVNRFGIELTLGRALDEYEPGRWAIAKFAFDSTALAGEWNPTGSYPTGMPNLFAQHVTFVKQAEIDTGSEIAAVIWEQGESDAGSVIVGSSYGIRLAEFIGAERYSLPVVPFIYGRLNAAMVGAGVQAVRVGQEANQTSSAIMVDQDSFALGGDHTHYTSASLVAMGPLFAKAVLSSESR